MHPYILIAILGLVIPVCAQGFLEQEDNFFGIPGVEVLSNRWFLENSDTTQLGFDYPVDIEVLKLAPTDYRLVILDAFSPHLFAFRIDQQSGLSLCGVHRSGEPPITEVDTCAYAISMCLMQSDSFFDPETDRLAVVFQYLATIGIYQFNPRTSEFALERMFSSHSITKPLGIYWAFDQFFITDEVAQAIFRTDNLGNYLSSYGRKGYHDDGHYWISDMSGYVDVHNAAHLYVSDGHYARVDHLTATANDWDLHLHSQVWPTEADTSGFYIHEPALIPDIGVVGFDRYMERFYLWDSVDSLHTATRNLTEWTDPIALPIHIWQVGGRFIVSVLDSLSAAWALRSYRVNEAVFDDPEPLPSDRWTLDISPILVLDSLHIPDGDSLIIDAGVQVLFEPCAALVVDHGAKLIINGTANDHVLLDAADTSRIWGGIYVQGGRLNMSFAEMHGCSLYCIWVDGPQGGNEPVMIEDCYLDGSKVGGRGAALQLWGSSSLKQSVINTTISNVPDGNGVYLYNCFVNFDGVTVNDCDVMNSYIKQVTGTFRNCTFTDRASEYGVLFITAGTTPNFQCCTFADLAPTSGTYTATVYAIAGTAPTFGWENSQNGVSNTFSDSCARLLYMSGYPVLPIIDNVKVGGGAGGRNDWYQKNDQNGKFIYWYNLQGLTQYSAENQYWQMGTRTYPTSSDFYAGGGVIDFNPWKTPAWELCGGSGASLRDNERTDERGGAGLDDGVDYDSLFTLALAEEIAENFAAAQPLFTTVATESDDDQLRWQALTHIVSTQRHLDVGDGEALIPDLIDGAITADSSAYESFVYGNRLLASYRTDRAEYDEAIDICTMLLGSGLTHDDSVIVAIELVGIQMLSGDFEEGGGLDGGFGNPVPAGLRVTSIAHGLELENQLLNALGVDDEPTYQPNVIPTSYQLYQNYPNPFNPLTEIRFDLPEKTHVELTIFNTLGQRVATLVNEVRPAGSFRMSWDGSSVASGVYLYQLKAASFVETKKMILLR